MYQLCNGELLTEAAGVKVVMSPIPESDRRIFENDARVEKILLVFSAGNGMSGTRDRSCGFHLTKSKWDPYPWVEYVERGSVADAGGLRSGDCLLEVNGRNLLGLKVKDVASLIRSDEYARNVDISVWRNVVELTETQEQTGLAVTGPLPEVVKRLASAVSGAVRSLECPICLETATPPVSQCVHGHILCVECRPKASRCPVCRVRLGQGRCLLADNLDRVFRDTFGVKVGEKDADAAERSSLRQRLFGRRNKHELRASAKDTSLLSRPRQLLLRRLLGGLDKAASAENLSTASQPLPEASSRGRKGAFGRYLGERAGLNDRAKSASTGELSRETGDDVNSVLSRANHGQASETFTNGSPTLSVPQTPTWGGSVDSVSNARLACPLSRTIGCRESCAPDGLLAHVNTTHPGPKIHFHSGSATMPFPLPFGDDAVYLLHHAGETFFFQHDREQAWMASAAAGSAAWLWILQSCDNDGTEIKLRRNVASLDEYDVLMPHHVAPLSVISAVDTIQVRLLEPETNDRLDI